MWNYHRYTKRSYGADNFDYSGPLWFYQRPRRAFLDGQEIGEATNFEMTIEWPTQPQRSEEEIRRIAREEARKELADLIPVDVPDTLPEEEK